MFIKNIYILFFLDWIKTINIVENLAAFCCNKHIKFSATEYTLHTILRSKNAIRDRKSTWNVKKSGSGNLKQYNFRDIPKPQ